MKIKESIRLYTTVILISMTFLMMSGCNEQDQRSPENTEMTPPIEVDPELPEFDWPPPQASALMVIPSDLVKNPQDEVTRLADVDAKLRHALDGSGYVAKKYFAVPDGFALVTQLEQINPDGTPKEPGRWSAETEPLQIFSIREYIRILLFADPGLFRIVVFIVTPHPFSESEKVVERDEAMNWLRQGFNTLLPSIANQEYTNEFATTTLVYEFEKPEGQEADLSLPSRLTARDHLMNSGLMRILED